MVYPDDDELVSSTVPPLHGISNYLSSWLLYWTAEGRWNGLPVTGGPIPTDGVNVTLPKNSRVVVGLDTTLSFVNIPGLSELFFKRTPLESRLVDTYYGIYVDVNLTIGSETCRLWHLWQSLFMVCHRWMPWPMCLLLKAVRVLSLSRTRPTSMDIGFIAPGLVLLTRAINPGDSVLMLQHAINWSQDRRLFAVLQ